MKKTALLALFSVLLLASWAYPRTISKADFVDSINILFMKENYSGLVATAERNMKRQRLTRTEKKEVLCLMGISYTKLGKYEEAREAFGKMLTMRGNKLREEAHIGIADSYFLERDVDRAIRAYDEALDLYPRSERLPSVYYNLGLCYKEKGNIAKSNAYFQKVKSDYSGSFEAKKAVYTPVKKRTKYYIIQLGAFGSLKNAKKLVRRLSRKGYDSYVQKVAKGGDVFYRVRGGKFSNKTYAKKLLRRLKRDRFSAKIIEE